MARRPHEPPCTNRRRARAAAALAGLLLISVGCGGRDEGAQPTPPGTGVMAGPDVRLAASLAPFDSCADVLRWFQDEALAQLDDPDWISRGMGGTVLVDDMAVPGAAEPARMTGRAGPDSAVSATPAAPSVSSPPG